MTELISRINENTSVPLKIVISVFVAAVGATWAISAQLSAVRAEISAISREIRSVNGKIDSAWTVQNMELWAAKMQRNNPSLHVPEAKDGFVFGKESGQ